VARRVEEVDAEGDWAVTMRLAVCIATMHTGNPYTVTDLDTVQSVYNNTTTFVGSTFHLNTFKVNDGVIGSYDKMYRDEATDVAAADVLAYIHDDVTVYEKGWDARVLKEFEDPEVGVVGFGGALRHGADKIYKTRYDYRQLARYLYKSNVDDAEVHGERFAGACDVAVVDGFAIAVRRSLLDRCGGWPVDTYPPMHLYDYWVCAMAHRLGYRVRVVGVRCQHHGGQTATSAQYQEWANNSVWGSDAKMHEKGHRLFYEDFRDVLPWRCD
jgi:GT2 family glycosyltransferase